METGVLGQQLATECCNDQRGSAGCSESPAVSSRKTIAPASSTLPSTSQHVCESRDVGRASMCGGQPCGRNVQEPVEVDPERALVDASGELGRRRPDH